IADDHEGVRLELKPAGVAVHTRQSDRQTARTAMEKVKSGPATFNNVQVTEGHEVIDLSVVTTHKGNALDSLRHELGAQAVLFIGDDITDENAFASLHGPDVGVRVGEGDSRAAFRINDTLEVA